MCNGRDHVKELNNQRPKQPFFFLKPPSSMLLPGVGPVLRPKGVSMHYEVELGLVMGKTVRDLDPEDTKGALDSIEGVFYISRPSAPWAMAPHT
jgi:2-keto-4-pentenoate hydratase/2-oxohepta-3-ene-1,7-dioic acid hydratase in catechol pathway